MRPLRALLDDLLTAVARSCPTAVDAMVARGAGLSVACACAGERFTLRVGVAGPHTAPHDPEAGVCVGASREALCALILGEDEVFDAARDGRLDWRGAAEDLARCEVLVRLLVAGAARAPDAGRLLDELLATRACAETIEGGA